jgi:hypothetical protein
MLVENKEFYSSGANELRKLITIAAEIHLFFVNYIFFTSDCRASVIFGVTGKCMT